MVSMLRWWKAVAPAMMLSACALPAPIPGAGGIPPTVYSKVVPAGTAPIQPPAAGALAARVLAIHNAERTRLGIAPLQWDAALARDASGHAAYLARLGRMEHSTNESRPDQGENLWMGSARSFAVEEMVGGWLAERSLFRRGAFPNVSSSGRWFDVGHYTQMVWRSTTHVGCALSSSGARDFLVCRYSPPGNWRGRSVY